MSSTFYIKKVCFRASSCKFVQVTSKLKKKMGSEKITPHNEIID